jgi:hypothetical protein
MDGWPAFALADFLFFLPIPLQRVLIKTTNYVLAAAFVRFGGKVILSSTLGRWAGRHCIMAASDLTRSNAASTPSSPC